MTTVAQVLQEKGQQVWSVSPDARVYDALKIMAERNIGALLVCEGDKLKGIFSERDYARKVILHGKSSREIAVKEIMSSDVITVRPQQSVEDCMALMTDKRIRHLPVVDGDRLVGVISIGDALREISSERELRIEQLQSYITSGG